MNSEQYQRSLHEAQEGFARLGIPATEFDGQSDLYPQEFFSICTLLKPSSLISCSGLSSGADHAKLECSSR